MFIKISDYKIFTLKSLFPFKNIKRGVFLLSKIRIKNSAGADMHIGALLIYFSDQFEDFGTLISKKKKMVKYHFKNGVNNMLQ